MTDTRPDYMEREVRATEIVEKTLADSGKSGVYFDPLQGWIAPEDEYMSDTGASLKAVIVALRSKGEISDDVYDAVERLLFKYSVLIRHGSTQRERKIIIWHLTEHPRKPGHALVSYQDGGEWFDGCYADEVPLWLLFSMFRVIHRRKPLGDQGADETIKTVRDAEYAYLEEREFQQLRSAKLITQRRQQ